MKTIIFGGSGLIGRALINSPGFKGQDLFVVSRNPGNHDLGAGVTLVSYDRRELQKLFSGEYSVVNLSGAGIGDKLWTSRRRKVIRESRVKVGHLIGQLVGEVRDKPKLIVQASAVGYYGSRGEETLTEKSSQGEGFLADVTADWEKSVQSAKLEGVRVVFLRTGLVLSTKAGFLNRLLLPVKMYVGGHFGNGKRWLPWIHIEDEVNAIRFLMKQNSSQGVYNLVAPKPIRMRDFMKILGKTMHRPSWLHLPSAVIRLIPGDFGKELMLTSQKIKPERLVNAGFEFKYTDLTDALNDLLDQ